MSDHRALTASLWSVEPPSWLNLQALGITAEHLAELSDIVEETKRLLPALDRLVARAIAVDDALEACCAPLPGNDDLREQVFVGLGRRDLWNVMSLTHGVAARFPCYGDGPPSQWFVDELRAGYGLDVLAERAAVAS